MFEVYKLVNFREESDLRIVTAPDAYIFVNWSVQYNSLFSVFVLHECDMLHSAHDRLADY